MIYSSVSVLFPPFFLITSLQWNSALAVNYPAREFGIKRGDSYPIIQEKSGGKCVVIHLPVTPLDSSIFLSSKPSSLKSPPSKSMLSDEKDKNKTNDSINAREGGNDDNDSTTQSNLIAQSTSDEIKSSDEQKLLDEAHNESNDCKDADGDNDKDYDMEDSDETNHFDSDFKSCQAAYDAEFNQPQHARDEMYKREKNKMRSPTEGKACLDRYDVLAMICFHLNVGVVAVIFDKVFRWNTINRFDHYGFILSLFFLLLDIDWPPRVYSRSLMRYVDVNVTPRVFSSSIIHVQRIQLSFFPKQTLTETLGKKNFILERASIDELFIDVTTFCFQSFVSDDLESKHEMKIGYEGEIQEGSSTAITFLSDCRLNARKSLKETVICHETKVDPAEMDDESGNALCLGCHIAFTLRRAVLQKLGFTLSAGISTSKLVAKLAASYGKPNGQVNLKLHAILLLYTFSLKSFLF